MSGRLEQINDWEARARQAGYSAAVLARCVGRPERTFRRYMAARLGTDLRHWLLDLRMRDAVALLTDGSSAKWVAAELGYSCSSSFDAAFKKWSGVSPGEFLRGIIHVRASAGGANSMLPH